MFLWVLFFIFIRFFCCAQYRFFSSAPIAQNLYLINPYNIYKSFVFVSDSFAQAVLLKWSHSDATVIVFFGFLAALVLRVISYAGIASLILLDKNGRKGLIEGAKKYKLHLIAIILYFIVLLVFFFQVKFINSRYSALLLILSVPILAVAVHGCKLKWPKLTNLFVFLSLLLMLSNVISTSTKKTHYLEAANWVQKNTKITDRIYYEDSRVAYYADRGYPSMPLITEVMKNKNYIDSYDYFVIESDLKNNFFSTMDGRK